AAANRSALSTRPSWHDELDPSASDGQPRMMIASWRAWRHAGASGQSPHGFWGITPGKSCVSDGAAHVATTSTGSVSVAVSVSVSGSVSVSLSPPVMAGASASSVSEGASLGTDGSQEASKNHHMPAPYRFRGDRARG